MEEHGGDGIQCNHGRQRWTEAADCLLEDLVRGDCEYDFKQAAARLSLDETVVISVTKSYGCEVKTITVTTSGCSFDGPETTHETASGVFVTVVLRIVPSCFLLRPVPLALCLYSCPAV